MKTRIHVNQHNIKANKKDGKNRKVITVKTYKNNIKCNNVDIIDKSGNVIATIKYQPCNPLSCGATVWVETELKVKTK